jgi:hypothetical protein
MELHNVRVLAQGQLLVVKHLHGIGHAPAQTVDAGI